jgi:hypothetical protein
MSIVHIYTHAYSTFPLSPFKVVATPPWPCLLDSLRNLSSINTENFIKSTMRPSPITFKVFEHQTSFTHSLAYSSVGLAATVANLSHLILTLRLLQSCMTDTSTNKRTHTPIHTVWHMHMPCTCTPCAHHDAMWHAIRTYTRVHTNQQVATSQSYTVGQGSTWVSVSPPGCCELKRKKWNGWDWPFGCFSWEFSNLPFIVHEVCGTLSCGHLCCFLFELKTSRWCFFKICEYTSRQL